MYPQVQIQIIKNLINVIVILSFNFNDYIFLLIILYKHKINIITLRTIQMK